MIHNEYFFSRDKKYEISSMDSVKYVYKQFVDNLKKRVNILLIKKKAVA